MLISLIEGKSLSVGASENAELVDGAVVIRPRLPANDAALSTLRVR